jgi:hypothetical protein
MTERTNKLIQRSDIIKYKSNFDYLKDANFEYSIKSTSDCFYITFKNTKGVFTWNDFKYDFIPLFEIIRERLRVDRKVEYFTKSYTKNAEATDIIDDNIEMIAR